MDKNFIEASIAADEPNTGVWANTNIGLGPVLEFSPAKVVVIIKHRKKSILNPIRSLTHNKDKTFTVPIGEVKELLFSENVLDGTVRPPVRGKYNNEWVFDF